MNHPPPIDFTSRIPNLVGHLIDNGRLRLVELLGRGAYGVVYRAVEEVVCPLTSPKEFAVKVLFRADPYSALGQAQSMEIMTHEIVSSHPNIITLHQVWEDDWYIFFKLDFCPGGDLYRAIASQPAAFQTDSVVKRVFLQILDAVECCHVRGIFHRDLKPENIFINRDGSGVLIGDFGLATDEEVSEGFGCGSANYQSPECIGEGYRSQVYNTRISDIWALGVILINLITGRSPWNRASFQDHRFRLFMRDPNHLLSMLPISRASHNILLHIFSIHPLDRITIPDLRRAITAVDTFFPSTENLSVANRDRACAGPAPPQNLVVVNPDVYGPPPAHADNLDPSLRTDHSSMSRSSAGDSVGPITPVTPNHLRRAENAEHNPLRFSRRDVSVLAKFLGRPHDELAGRLDEIVAGLTT